MQIIAGGKLIVIDAQLHFPVSHYLVEYFLQAYIKKLNITILHIYLFVPTDWVEYFYHIHLPAITCMVVCLPLSIGDVILLTLLALEGRRDSGPLPDAVC